MVKVKQSLFYLFFDGSKFVSPKVPNIYLSEGRKIELCSTLSIPVKNIKINSHSHELW